jgi:primase-polymerase (primpol)-like protein
MLAAARWTRADGKRPCLPDGRLASSRDPSTWARFSEVQRGAGDGFGFMLGGGFGCYDLDHWPDDRARRFVAAVREPVLWVERSVSGEGVHVFFQGPEVRGRRSMVGGRPVERYSWARFIRVTGVAFR